MRRGGIGPVHGGRRGPCAGALSRGPRWTAPAGAGRARWGRGAWLRWRGELWRQRHGRRRRGHGCGPTGRGGRPEDTGEAGLTRWTRCTAYLGERTTAWRWVAARSSTNSTVALRLRISVAELGFSRGAGRGYDVLFIGRRTSERVRLE